MIINLDDCYNKIEIEEFLEPTGACYEIRQGENKIQFHTDYLLDELSKTIQFVLHRNELYKCQLEN